MASGPHWNKHRGTWSVQYWDGGWHRIVVVRKQPGWKPGDRKPKVPPEAKAELVRLEKIEKEAKSLRKKKLPESLDVFLKKRIEIYKNENSKQTVKFVVDQFLAWCEGKKIDRFNQVTSEVCGEWIDLQQESFAYATVKRKRAILSAAWKKVCKRKKIANPWDDVELEGKDADKERGSWTKEEFAKLHHAARPWLKDLLALGVYTGLRIGALMTLEWSHITWAAPESGGYGWVKVTRDRAKGNKYDVPISTELYRVLKRRQRMYGGARFVLCGQGGMPISKRSVTGDAITRACLRAKLPKPDSPNHHMRRTFGRWAIAGHLTGTPVPLFVVSRWYGHSSVAVTMKYLDITEDDSTKFMVPMGRIEAEAEGDHSAS